MAERDKVSVWEDELSLEMYGETGVQPHHVLNAVGCALRNG
jgi:hypothetical protein